jgi:hypothetical protein
VSYAKGTPWCSKIVLSKAFLSIAPIAEQGKKMSAPARGTFCADDEPTGLKETRSALDLALARLFVTPTIQWGNGVYVCIEQIALAIQFAVSKAIAVVASEDGNAFDQRFKPVFYS